MKFLSQNSETKKLIEQVLKEAADIKLAVAFWGYGSSETIKMAKNKKVRIICNLESGATNPHELIKIGKLINFKNIRSIKNLHAKVYLTNNKMILGSSNFSANGLSLEGDETNKLIEANVLIDNQLIIKQAHIWFNSLWNKAKPINEKYCAEYFSKWLSNRKRNEKRKIDSDFFIAFENGEYTQEKIYLTIDTMGFTKEEERIGNQAAKESVKNDLFYSGKEISFWYDYPSLPRNAFVISFYYSKSGKLSCYGIYRTLPKSYDRKGYQFCYKISEALLNKKHLEQITTVLKLNIKKMKIPHYYGLEMKLTDFYKKFNQLKQND